MTTTEVGGADLAGRSYARVYRVRRNRSDLHAFLVAAVGASGGQVLYASRADRAPVYLGVAGPRGERLGLLVYPFRMTDRKIRNRPSDEVRGQIRYGSESSWNGEHSIGRDVAGVDITIILGVNLDIGLFVGLQPALYDPLPMGISFYAKRTALEDAARDGWRVWERAPQAGRRRGTPRVVGLETLVAFNPDRLLDYARFEQQATDLNLDQPLRFTAARAAAASHAAAVDSTIEGHSLERQFDLSSAEILEIISTRTRLAVAVRGGVAEYHLERILRTDPAISSVARLDQDSQHDFDLTIPGLDWDRKVRVECKNASPEAYANHDLKVEVQKTRASKSDPASRFYRRDQFDVVAACLFSPTGSWTFRYRATSAMAVHAQYSDRLAPMQRIDASWSDTVADALTPTT